MSDPLNHLGSFWYHSEPSDVTYFPNQFLGWDFFCHFLQQDSSLMFCNSFTSAELDIYSLNLAKKKYMICTYSNLLIAEFSYSNHSRIEPRKKLIWIQIISLNLDHELLENKL